MTFGGIGWGVVGPAVFDLVTDEGMELRGITDEPIDGLGDGHRGGMEEWVEGGFGDTGVRFGVHGFWY